MFIDVFFEEIEIPLLYGNLMDEHDCLVSQIKYGLKGVCEEDLKDYDVAIIGIADETNAVFNEGSKNAVYRIRSRLASLRKTTGALKIIDLGNLKGKTLDDKYFALKAVCDFLLNNSIKGIILGGGHDFTYPVVQSLSLSEKNYNLAIIDSCIDGLNGVDFSSKNFIEKMLNSCENKASECYFLGLQKYFIGVSQEDFLEKNNYSLIRLRDLRGEHIIEAEPFLREANVVSFDIGAVESAYVTTQLGLNVNGFTGAEACKLAWYSGMGTANDFFCFHEFNPEIDKFGKGEVLSAEILWHFVEANSTAVKEFPLDNKSLYKTFIVHLHNFKKDIRFYKNRYNNRWWMELEKEGDCKIVACSEKDYKFACTGELPERWWRNIKNSY